LKILILDDEGGLIFENMMALESSHLAIIDLEIDGFDELLEIYN
jgi:hypothetical protein